MWGSTSKSCPQNWSSQCKEIKEWMFILCLLHVRPVYPCKILPYKGTFSDTELGSQGGYLLVHDQTVSNNRSAPSHLGNSWDVNVPSASEGPENDAHGKVSRRKADPKEARVTETVRKKQLRRVKQWVSLGVDIRWVICIYSHTLRDLRDYISSKVQLHV